MSHRSATAIHADGFHSELAARRTCPSGVRANALGSREGWGYYPRLRKKTTR